MTVPSVLLRSGIRRALPCRAAAVRGAARGKVLDAPGGGSRVVWIADLLPHDLAASVAAMMEQGLEVMRRTLEAAARPER